MADDPRTRLLTAKQVAARLKTSVSGVRRLVRDGLLHEPVTLAAKSQRWFVGDVESCEWALLRGRLAGPGPEKV